MTMPGMEKVLIVDDEDMVRILLSQLLERASVDQSNILMAGDGEEALDVVAHERPGLIILDLMLPRLSGYHVCREIRSIPNYDPYIIILTGRGYNTDREQARSMGANGFMTKPFNTTRLIEELNNFRKRS